MVLETRSWWVKGERVAWDQDGKPAIGTVAEPRGDYSWVAVDGAAYGETLVANDRLHKLTPALDPAKH
jgi:hypothetical protein